MSYSPPSAERFSDRVADYTRYRPSYPAPAVDYMIREAGLKPGDAVADIGSGTGISARLFLNRGFTVYGVEPSSEMRSAGEQLLADYRSFQSIDGTAESTTLPDAAASLVLCAQAFHWFASEEAVTEFRRIARPGGTIALIWNCRLTETTPFLRHYESLLLRAAPDYPEVNHENITSFELERLFGQKLQFAEFPNEQSFDWEGFRGRALSCSYVPAPGQPGHEDFMAALHQLFLDHHDRNQVTFSYTTRVYLARC